MRLTHEKTRAPTNISEVFRRDASWHPRSKASGKRGKYHFAHPSSRYVSACCTVTLLDQGEQIISLLLLLLQPDFDDDFKLRRLVVPTVKPAATQPHNPSKSGPREVPAKAVEAVKVEQPARRDPRQCVLFKIVSPWEDADIYISQPVWIMPRDWNGERGTPLQADHGWFRIGKVSEFQTPGRMQTGRTFTFMLAAKRESGEWRTLKLMAVVGGERVADFTKSGQQSVVTEYKK